MKDSIGNCLTKSLATAVIAAVTALLFITTAIAGIQLGDFSAYLPIVILSTSSLSIMSIWLFGRPRKPDSPSLKQLEQLKERINDLETRISNTEIVNNFENRLAERTLNSSRSTSSTQALSSD